eukprot:scaffold68717_cov69-Phaeocystis_antarctica.AAC.9
MLHRSCHRDIESPQMPTRTLRGTLRRSVKSIVGLGARTKYTYTIFSLTREVSREVSRLHWQARAARRARRGPRSRLARQSCSQYVHRK